MVETVVAAKAFVVGLWFLALFILERRLRAALPPSSRARLWRNGGFWLISFAISPLVVVPLTAWGVNHALWTRPDWMASGAVGIIFLTLNLVLLDLWTYVVHRAYHVVPAMWRLHEVHHRDEFLDTTSAVRFHFGEIILSALLRLLPIVLLSVPLTTVIIFETLLFCSALFHHSNIKLPARVEKRLSRIIVTPSIHWVHHHAVKQDTDSNYAAVLSLWDRVFGSFSPSRRTLEMKIGVEGVEDQSFLRLILMPFRR